MSERRFDTFPCMIFSSMAGGVSFPFAFRAAASRVCCLWRIKKQDRQRMEREGKKGKMRQDVMNGQGD